MHLLCIQDFNAEENRMPQNVPALRGTQTVLRATHLLKQISNHHPHGIMLTDLAAQVGLDRATAYRLASALVTCSLAERDESKRYKLGPDAMQLGLAAMRGAPILERCQPLMKRIARRTEDTVFLVIRNGDYGHCIHSEEGTYPVKALVLQVGGMQVLGIGSAGITLLANLADSEISAIYTRHRLEFKSRFQSFSNLKRLVDQTRSRGYADTCGLVNPEVSGLGMYMQITNDFAAAISVAAIKSRMTEERKKWIADLVLEEVANAGLQRSEV